jgi:hypothetical protein
MSKLIFAIIFALLLITAIVLLAIFIKPNKNKHHDEQQPQNDEQKSDSKVRDFNPNDSPKPQIKLTIHNDFSVLDKWRSYSRPELIKNPFAYKRNLQTLSLPSNVEEIICKFDLYPGSYGWYEKFPKHDTIKMYRDSELFYILNTTQGIAFTRNIKTNIVTNTFKL